MNDFSFEDGYIKDNCVKKKSNSKGFVNQKVDKIKLSDFEKDLARAIIKYGVDFKRVGREVTKLLKKP